MGEDYRPDESALAPTEVALDPYVKVRHSE
jgi:hypothetical protein